MTRRFDFEEWQGIRGGMRAVQAAGLVEAGPSASAIRSAPAGLRPKDDQTIRPRPLHSHRPRGDEEWRAIADGVRALLAERVASGRWVWTGPRRLMILGR